MKKALLPILAITMFMLILSPLTMAANNGDISGSSATPPVNIPEFSTGLNIWKLLDKALNWFFNFAVIIAALFIIYSGWLYVTAGGDEEKAKKGLNTLIYALIGVGIALLAKGLVYVIGQFVAGQALSI